MGWIEISPGEFALEGSNPQKVTTLAEVDAEIAELTMRYNALDPVTVPDPTDPVMVEAYRAVNASRARGKLTLEPELSRKHQLKMTLEGI